VRRLIAGMKVSLDEKVQGPEGFADWVDAWSEDYGLTPEIDACLLGGGMYPGYEKYWTALANEPETPLPMTGKMPTAGEVQWARFIPQTTHYVFSNTLTSARWPNTRFVRGLDEITALKHESGKHIYLIGGARTTASLIDAGLVDELRLIVHPLLAGGGSNLFGATERRRQLELRKAQQLTDGRVSLIYGIA
jgi:dihydrofolate reductase